MQPTRPPWPHKSDHLHPQKLTTFPTLKLTHPTTFPTQIRAPPHTNSSTFPAKNRHNFEHLPSQKIDTSVQSAGDFKFKNHDCVSRFSAIITSGDNRLSVHDREI